MKKLAEKVSMTVFMVVLALCLPACTKKSDMDAPSMADTLQVWHYECQGLAPFDLHVDKWRIGIDNDGRRVMPPDNCKITVLK